MERVTSKYADWTRGQVEALINIIGEDNAKRLLTGEISVELKEIAGKLFDKHGRRIPECPSISVCDANWDFQLNQPKLEQDVDYANRIKRLHECLGVDTNVTAQQLKQETERLLVLIRDNSQIANITKGVYLPVILPKLTTNDLGETLEQYLEAVGKSYAKTFSDREFHNYRKGALAGEVNIVDGSRHDQLIEWMKQGPVIGIHFPNPLQGFSTNASREQMSTLPEGFILSGMDTPIAMAMYPDIMARDYGTPSLEMAALSWQSAYSLDFKCDNYGIEFDRTRYLDDAEGGYSGGLLFIG